jgi:hypothetical protein
MFTWITTAVATLLARRGVKVAGAAIPYCLAATPAVVAVVSFAVGYQHGDFLARAALCGLVAGEALVAFQIDGRFDALFEKS